MAFSTSTGLKAATLVVAASLSWAVTWPCWSQRPGRGRRDPGPPRPKGPKSSAPRRSYPTAPREPALPPGQTAGRTEALFGMPRCRLTAGPGRVSIEAQASIMDARPQPGPYMWSVLVMDPSAARVLHTQHYAHQVFQVESGKTSNPTFQDTLPLAPGDYHVELRLYAVSPQADPTTPLKGGSKMLVSGGGPISITEG